MLGERGDMRAPSGGAVVEHAEGCIRLSIAAVGPFSTGTAGPSDHEASVYNDVAFWALGLPDTTWVL